MSEQATLGNDIRQEGEKDLTFGKFPVDWRGSPLSDASVFDTTSSGLESFSGSKVYIPTGGVDGRRIVETDGEITYEDRPSRANLEIENGDVLFAKMKDSIKVLRGTDKTSDDHVFSTGFIRVRSESGINSEYLTQIFLSNKFNQRKDSLAIGSTQPAIGLGDLSGLTVPIPPLEEQRKIASVLYTVDQAIHKTEEVIDQLDRTKQGLTQTLFLNGYYDYDNIIEARHRNRLSQHPTSWDTKPAKDVMDVTRGAHPRPKSDTSLWGGDIPMIKIGDRDRGDSRTITSTEDYVTEKGSKSSKLVDEGTLIVSNAGTVGAARITGMKTCIHDHWLILRDYERELDTRYLYHFINWNQDFLESLASGSTVLDLNTDDFRLFDITIPELEEQQEIADVLDSLHDEKTTNQQYRNQLKWLKQGLMQDLLSGEVRTHNRDIEIVEEILAHG